MQITNDDKTIRLNNAYKCIYYTHTSGTHLQITVIAMQIFIYYMATINFAPSQRWGTEHPKFIENKITVRNYTL